MGEDDRARPRDARVRVGILTRGRPRAPAACDLDYAVLGVRTTGRERAEGARVCEIAVLRMRGDGTVAREFTTLVDPGVPISGQELHGISSSDVVGAPRAADIAGELATLLSGAVLVGHDLDVEGLLLDSGLLPAGPRLPGLCAMRTLRSQVDLECYALSRASLALNGHWPVARHTALGDARAHAQLLAELIHNAPGELRFVGAGPARLHARARAGAPRLKPRVSSGTLPFTPVRDAPLRALAAWPHCWRPLQLDPALCGGRFDAPQRAAAVADAARRRARREAIAATAALTGALATTAAGRLALRRLR